MNTYIKSSELVADLRKRAQAVRLQAMRKLGATSHRDKKEFAVLVAYADAYESLANEFDTSIVVHAGRKFHGKGCCEKAD